MGGSSSKDKPSVLSRFKATGKDLKKKFLSTIDEVDEPVSKQSYFDSHVSEPNLTLPNHPAKEEERKPFPGEDDKSSPMDATPSGKPALLARQFSGYSNS